MKTHNLPKPGDLFELKTNLYETYSEDIQLDALNFVKMQPCNNEFYEDYKQRYSTVTIGDLIFCIEQFYIDRNHINLFIKSQFDTADEYFTTSMSDTQLKMVLDQVCSSIGIQVKQKTSTDDDAEIVNKEQAKECYEKFCQTGKVKGYIFYNTKTFEKLWISKYEIHMLQRAIKD
jgi:hypothetical protein